MNSYDLMVEKYRRELMTAANRSTLPRSEQDIPTAPPQAAFSTANPEEVTDSPSQMLRENSSTAYYTYDEPETSFTDELNRESEDNTDTSPRNTSEQSQPEVIQSDEPQRDSFVSDEETDAAGTPIDTPADTPPVTSNKSPTDTDAFEDEPEIDLTLQGSFGTLRLEIFAADRAYAIPNAEVTIANNGKPDEIVFSGYSDTSGIVAGIRLPAPDNRLTDRPGRAKGYSSYDIDVKHPRFKTVKFIGVPVFAGIESVQPVSMTPKFGNNDETIIYQSEPLGLRRFGETKGWDGRA